MDRDFIQTRCSRRGPTAKLIPAFQSVVYESYKPRTERDSSNKDNIRENNDALEFNLKRAKNEVCKLGISGLDKSKKEAVTVQLAVKLGAKPPKKQYKNYKTLLLEKTKKTQQEKHESEFLQLGKNAIGKAKTKTKLKKPLKRKEGLLEAYGKATLKTKT